VCGTIRVNRGLPKDMIKEANNLKKGEVTFRRKQDVLLVTHQDKRLVNMISTLHTAAVVDDFSIVMLYLQNPTLIPKNHS
jgi:hypothetical protein